MTNPYLIHGPALISFSGGRTSGFLLKHVIDAHGGELPTNVFAVFADTGREHPATYRFVRDCAEHWGVEIHTVAYDRGDHVTPYDALIARKRYLPNPTQRFCTQYLKVEPLAAFMRAKGYETWTNVVGIRADEEHRISNILKKARTWATAFPLAFADVTEADVLRWWRQRNFDLGIPPGFGNCVGCFLKSRAQIIAIEQAMPGSLQWYADKEAEVGGTFRSDRDCYSKLIDFAKRQCSFDFGDDAIVECGCHD